jgi:serine/threonine protein kinase, bacterial
MGSDIDARADQYALGCTAFQLLTGAAPYQNSNAAVVISQHLSAPPPQIGERRPELAELNDPIAKVLAKDPGDRYSSCSHFAAALTGQPAAGAARTVAAQPAAAPTARVTPAQHSPPPKPPRRGLRPAVLIAAVATLLVLAVAGVVGTELLRQRAHHPDNSATIDRNPSGNGANDANPPGNSGAVASPAIQLTRYISDPAGVLTPSGRTAVQGAISKLYAQRNVHLWVAYVHDFSGFTPLRWAEETMRANGFSDTDGLLAIATAHRTFAFRPPAALTNGTDGTHVNAELIRVDRIAPAVRNDEWARAAVGAANGLEAAR